MPSASEMGFAPEPFMAQTKPDTVRVGPATYLLRNRGFTETIALARDTVFLFDATR